jgi:serine/threonine-protein kinase
MSPEQMRSARQVDVRADIWSLGVMMYELMVGEVPFVAESMPQLVALVLEGNAPKIREMLPDAPESLEAIVAKCLERKVEDRYQTVGPLAADIATVLGTEEARVSAARIARVLEGAGTRVEGTGQYHALPPTTAPIGALTRPGVQTTPGLSLGQTGVEPEAPKKKPIGLIVGVALGALAVAGGLAFAFGNKPATTPAAGNQAGQASETPAPKPSAPAASTTAIERASATPSVVATASATVSASASASAIASAKPTTTARPVPTFVPATKPTATSTSTAKPGVDDDIFKKRQG